MVAVALGAEGAATSDFHGTLSRQLQRFFGEPGVLILWDNMKSSGEKYTILMSCLAVGFAPL